MLAILLFWTLLFAPVTAFMASQRGYHVMPWYLIGLGLGPIGLFAGLLPKRKHAPELLFAPEWQSYQIGE
ncbi:MAG: hypothetical protein JNL52_08795 [Flavobacteriales bacterium]|nr:hypothetical protein [Flavobacteriales bacterium]